MPGPSKWHLRGPVISTLNHICESEGPSVRLCSVCLGWQDTGVIGVTVHPPTLPPTPQRDEASGLSRHTSTDLECRCKMCLKSTNGGTNTGTFTSGLLQTNLSLDLHDQSESLSYWEHMVLTERTKQTRWPPWCTVHQVRLVFPSPLTRSIYTDSKSTPQPRLGLHTQIPVIIQTYIAAGLFFSPPCSISVNSTSKLWRGQIDSGRQMLFHKGSGFEFDHSELQAATAHNSSVSATEAFSTWQLKNFYAPCSVWYNVKVKIKHYNTLTTKCVV